MYYPKSSPLQRVIVILYLISASFLWGMEQDFFQQDEKLSLKDEMKVDIKRIKPFSSKPLVKVPDYLYGNCSKVTQYTWTPEYFAKLKSTVKNMTKEKLVAKSQEFKKLAKDAEVYDWIHALNLLEAEYLAKDIKALTLADLKKINGYLTRLRVGNQGEFRNRNMVLNKRKPSITEEVFIGYYTSRLQDIVQHKDPYLKLDMESKEFDMSDLMQWAAVLNGDNWDLLNPETGERAKLDTKEIEAWEREQISMTGYTPGKINWLEWEKPRLPVPNDIERKLKAALKLLKNSKLHPIEIAARIWYEISHIYPWGKANKRTGRVIASLILLKHGYLPPLITKEDAERYQKVFLEGFEIEGGHISFIRFIAELIIKTQQAYAQKSLK